ncbi:hypothetical protein SAMN04515617_12625 [Collimonas sp. OK242]|jgi:hypothetical protein|uniref:hypothetical protein n=1 Tax=Collimonas sp. OK242 TaxID=1798195 RepID=UPI000895D73B|nr:hypothetical protein [Collimonas sp. OK242]SDY87201.1 hypothetical protein SAMN04515617_12625 [Collimonas sp. OK242]
MFAMNRLKNLLILLLALTLPIQGYAAAAMVFCGSEKITAASAAGDGDATAHHMHAQNADLPSKARHGGHEHSAQDKNSSSCSSCAACCVGAIPMQSALPAAQALPAMHFTQLPLSGFVGYTPENPERPPSVLA